MVKPATTLRRCVGSERFGIPTHEAPVAEFPQQPSQKDGLGRMCAVHWKAYVKSLRESRKPETGMAADPAKGTTKRERRRTPMANAPKTESPRVRKAVGSAEVQAALETVNGHGSGEPDDDAILVAGVLYDAETLEEAETVDDGIPEASGA